MDEPREIDWSTAAVSGGTLTVELTGEPSRSWSEHLEGVVARLEPRRSSSIKATRRRIKISGVAEGSADALRHLLESAVQQTNADLVAPAAGRDGAGEQGSGEDPADQALTDAFRAYGSRREPSG